MSNFSQQHTTSGTLRRLFLERRSYRQRRIIDAARLLPVVGLILWLVPLVWSKGEADIEISTSIATLYVFAIWIGVIVAGAFLAWRMNWADGATDGATTQAILSKDALPAETSQQDRPAS